MNYRTKTTNIVISGLLIAIGVIVPSIFHTTGIAGDIFLPMHIPVLIGGFLLSPIYAFLVGILTPLSNSLLTGMPPLFPIAIIMVFELGIYGVLASYLYRKLRVPVIISLIFSMIVGRIVAGAVVYVLTIAFSTVKMDPLLFVRGGIITGIPGIIIQIILIPILIHGINKYTTINLD
ncbi:ECF transporter S component [Tissierella creatinophila]|uniref:ECF transporter S component n=1 Tax=Tissierella creatinophila DSM 6911 TaxID=1123403 RepID=A0A1U7M8S9_TISCR|nr:ECF transporter S component [Tissierella creatinophila]OLS03650.1 hypothetical protein TICRE_03460 [Tissierella creatinophila DSM 6911]